MKPIATLRLTKREPRRRLYFVGCVILVFLLAACTTPNFLHDAKGSDNPEAWDQDLNECQSIVERRHSAGWAAVKSGLFGAVTGGGLAYGAHKLGHVTGNLGYAVAAAAVTGAILSGAISGLQTNGRNQEMMKKCLEGRGHVILE